MCACEEGRGSGEREYVLCVCVCVSQSCSPLLPWQRPAHGSGSFAAPALPESCCRKPFCLCSGKMLARAHLSPPPSLRETDRQTYLTAQAPQSSHVFHWQITLLQFARNLPPSPRTESLIDTRIVSTRPRSSGQELKSIGRGRGRGTRGVEKKHLVTNHVLTQMKTVSSPSAAAIDAHPTLSKVLTLKWTRTLSSRRTRPMSSASSAGVAGAALGLQRATAQRSSHCKLMVAKAEDQCPSVTAACSHHLPSNVNGSHWILDII